MPTVLGRPGHGQDVGIQRGAEDEPRRIRGQVRQEEGHERRVAECRQAHPFEAALERLVGRADDGGCVGRGRVAEARWSASCGAYRLLLLVVRRARHRGPMIVQQPTGGLESCGRRPVSLEESINRETTMTAAQPAGSDTAADFTRRLADLRAGGGEVPMRDIFALAKEFSGMDPAEIEALLEADDHELRVGAVSIMDFQARDRKHVGGAPPGAVRALRPPPRSHRHVGPGRSRRSVRGRWVPRRQATRSAVRPCPIRRLVGAADRDRGHVLLHPAGRPGRHVRHRRHPGR